MSWNLRESDLPRITYPDKNRRRVAAHGVHPLIAGVDVYRPPVWIVDAHRRVEDHASGLLALARLRGAYM